MGIVLMRRRERDVRVVQHALVYERRPPRYENRRVIILAKGLFRAVASRTSASMRL